MKACMRDSSSKETDLEVQSEMKELAAADSKAHHPSIISSYPSELFSGHRIRELELPNRIVVPPMCMYSADAEGSMSNFHSFQYSEYAIGGAGLVIVEATAVCPAGRLSNGCMGMYNEGNILRMRELNNFIHSTTKSKTGIQLNHGGRKAGWTKFPWAGDYRPLTPEEGAWQPMAPSPIPYDEKSPMPREMSLADIEEVKLQFVESARRAVEAGFDVIEIHAAHGYLLNQFLSPISNRRSDNFGGSQSDRFRFVLEVCGAVREAIPLGMPLAIRLSATEWVEGGLDLDATIALCVQLKEIGVDIFDISTGGNCKDQKIPAKPGFQVPFAAAVKKVLPGATVISAGLITEPEQAELYVMKGQTDLVAIGREMLRNPRWPRMAAHRLGAQGEVFTPLQYACLVRSRP